MGEKSAIEWTDSSWSPIRARSTATGAVGWHCEHVTPGCERCYAETLNKRLGTGLPFKPGHRKHIELFLDEKMLLAPLGWKKPRMIFVCSMTDAFATFVKDEWLDRMFAVMALCPQHTFQVLTKRSERMRKYVGVRHSRNAVELAAESLKPSEGKPFSPKHCFAWPLPNVWLGISAEDQERADDRIPDLLATPTAVRFVSAEPLLGPIDLGGIVRKCLFDGKIYSDGKTHPLGWVIVGGESGGDARDCRVEWGSSIQAQCAAAGVACFRKQLGSRPVVGDLTGWRAPATLLPDSSGYLLKLKSSKGGDPEEWPPELRVREMPSTRASDLFGQAQQPAEGRV